MSGCAGPELGATRPRRDRSPCWDPLDTKEEQSCPKTRSAPDGSAWPAPIGVGGVSSRAALDLARLKEACLGWGCYAYLLDHAARALRRPAIRRASERITGAIRVGLAFASRSSAAESPLGRCPNWP